MLPRRLQIEFAGIVQHYTDQHGGEIQAATIWQLFQQHYVQSQSSISYITHHLFESGNFQGIRIAIEQHGQSQWITGAGNGI